MLHIKLFQKEVCPKRQSEGSGTPFNSDSAEVQVQEGGQASLQSNRETPESRGPQPLCHHLTFNS